MSLPRRSARLAPSSSSSQHRHHLSASPPNFPHSSARSHSQPSSTSTTSHPSPINDSMLNPPPPPPTPYTPNAASRTPQFPPRLQVQGQTLQPQQSHLNAPLPSPSAAELPSPFDFGGAAFRPHSQPNMFQQQHQQNLLQREDYSQSQSHIQQHHNSVSQHNQLPIQGTGGGGGGGGHLGHIPPPEFLAEAAKRAQMACLMRDLGDVSL